LRLVALGALTLLGLVAAAAVAHDFYGDANAASPATTTAKMAMTSTMKMKTSTTPVTVKGAKPMSGMAMPMAITPLGQATWQGMRIRARAMSPSTFILLEDGKQQYVRPTKQDDIHLMVMLNDSATGMAIPYSSVWATIHKGTKLVYDERLWPMLSRYMGIHYGNNVELSGAGTYRLTLLVTPPQAARHVEYANRWLAPHRVSLTFNWKPAK
jgi:uncharacterized protein involved in high-affinity Fe2+ transport